jgi:hypothetical protein
MVYLAVGRGPVKMAILYWPLLPYGDGILLPGRGTLVEYPGHFLVKRVTNAGTIRLKKRCCSWPTRSNGVRWFRGDDDGI